MPEITPVLRSKLQIMEGGRPFGMMIKSGNHHLHAIRQPEIVAIEKCKVFPGRPRNPSISGDAWATSIFLNNHFQSTIFSC
jgi:hypothetical protein